MDRNLIMISRLLYKYHVDMSKNVNLSLSYTFELSPVLSSHIFYAPNFEEVEGAYWFGSVRAVSQSVCLSVCDA